MTTPTDYDPKRLIDPQAMPVGSPSTIYTSPNGQQGTQLTSIYLTNTGGVDATVYIYVVENGSSADAAHKLVDGYVLPADGLPFEIFRGSSSYYLNADDTVQGYVESGQSVTIHMSGVELN